jgi:hypothetical protein
MQTGRNRVIAFVSQHTNGSIYGYNLLPARFWTWVVGEEEEFNFGNTYWKRSTCTKYLTSEQLTYLKGE